MILKWPDVAWMQIVTQFSPKIGEIILEKKTIACISSSSLELLFP